MTGGSGWETVRPVVASVAALLAKWSLGALIAAWGAYYMLGAELFDASVLAWLAGCLVMSCILHTLTGGER